MSSTDAPIASRLPRVAYIVSRFPKLTETFVLNELVAMERLGTRIELYPLLRERQTVRHPEAERWTDRAHFQPFISAAIVRAQLHYLRRRPLAYLRLWLEVVRETWGSLNFLVGAIGIFPKAVRIAYELERSGVGHVHAHFANHPAAAAFIIHRLTGIPYSFTAHGSDLHVDRRMLPAKVAAAAFVATVSEYNRELIVRECGEHVRSKVRVVHCGVDPAEFAPPEAAARVAGAPLRIVCVASFEEVKGHTYLIEAIRELRARGVAARATFVGDGPLRGALTAQIGAAGLQDAIALPGGLPRAQVAEVVRSSHVAVLASCRTKQGKREGIPVALMEAMACGLPVVASALSGIPELVADGVSGLLVPPGDPGALAAALARLANDPALCRELGAGARARVLADFDLERNARLLQGLMAAASPTPPAALPAVAGARLRPDPV